MSHIYIDLIQYIYSSYPIPGESPIGTVLVLFWYCFVWNLVMRLFAWGLLARDAYSLAHDIV